MLGPASVIVGNLVQGNRLAAARGRDVGSLEDEMGGTGGMMMGGGGLNESSMGGAGRKYHFISEILRLRAHSTSDHLLFTLLNSKGTETQTLTCSQLHKKAERIARLLIEKVFISQRFLSLLPRCFSYAAEYCIIVKISKYFSGSFEHRRSCSFNIPSWS